MREYNEEMGKRRAKEEGEKIGEEKKQKEIAKRLKEEQIPIEIIMRKTKLSKKEIEDL